MVNRRSAAELSPLAADLAALFTAVDPARRHADFVLNAIRGAADTRQLDFMVERYVADVLGTAHERAADALRRHGLPVVTAIDADAATSEHFASEAA